MKVKHLLVFFIVYFPIAPVLENYFSLDVGGYSFWITVCPFLILMFLFFRKWAVMNSSMIFLLLTFVLLLILVIIARTLSYNVDKSIASQVIGAYILLGPIIITENFSKVRFDDKFYNLITVILICHLTFNSVIGFLYILGYPTIEYKTMTVEVIGSRFAGIYGNPNVYSNFVFIIYLIIVLINPKNWYLVIYSSMALIPVIMSSLSRAPLILFFFTLLFILRDKFKFKFIVPMSALFMFIYFSVSKLWEYGGVGISNRMIGLFESGDTGSRDEKFYQAMELTFSSISSIFIGVSPELLQKGYNISDNSLTLILTSYGVFLPLLWGLIIWISSRKKFNRLLKQKSVIYFSFAVLLIFITNNALLWLSGVFFAIVGFYMISNVRQSKNKVDVR
tara:strand:+ start:126 stop:1301 length:1176 start_codon:yes stop_codon:yes gene_type:complete